MNEFIKIQRPYFDWLIKIFGNLAKESEVNHVDAGIIARDYLSKPDRRSRFQKEHLPQLCLEVTEFWKANFDLIESELIKTPGLKARFCGDLGPQIEDYIFERIGLYFDTIIIPDPLMKIAAFQETMTRQEDYYFVKYAINNILLKDIFLADLSPPIGILIGDPRNLQESINYKNSIKISDIDLILVTNKLYGTNLKTLDDVERHFSKFEGSVNAVENMAYPELFYFFEDAQKDPKLQLQMLGDEYQNLINPEADHPDAKAAAFIPFAIESRLIQSNYELIMSNKYNSNLITSSPISYHWLALKLEANQEFLTNYVGNRLELNLAETNSLLSRHLKWLSNVPLNALIELRQKRKLSELRKIIDEGLSSISNIGIDNFEAISNQIDYNISSALETHLNEVEELDRSFRSELKISIPTFLIGVSVALQPGILGWLPSWLGPVGGIVGLTSLTDLAKSIDNYMIEKRKLAKSPAGILWDARNKSVDSES